MTQANVKRLFNYFEALSKDENAKSSVRETAKMNAENIKKYVVMVDDGKKSK